MTELAFDGLVTRIRNVLGCGKELASDYARAIGVKPEIQNGKVIVRDRDGRIIAHFLPSVVSGESVPVRSFYQSCLSRLTGR